MKKHLANKLRSKRGETFAEILVGILIIALSATLFASAISASGRIQASVKAQDQMLYDAVSSLEEMTASEKTETTQGTVQYRPEGENKDHGAAGDIDADLLSQDGLTVYKSRGAA